MTKEQIIDELFQALEVKRHAYKQRLLTLDAWLYESKVIFDEAESHGVTGDLYLRVHAAKAVESVRERWTR